MQAATEQLVNLNGELLPLEKASLPITDRGILFGDGVYEVIAIYNGQCRALDKHLDRLANSLKAILLTSPLSKEAWRDAILELIKKNSLTQEDGAVYLQVTRGESFPRDFNFAEDAKAHYFIQTRKHVFPSYQTSGKTYKAITHEDIRRAHCYIKSTCLQPCALLKHEAVQAGAEECIMHRNGLLTEGTASNVFLVKDGIIYTPPLTKSILPGVTRGLVIELCENLGYAVKEIAIPLTDLYQADELWLTSTTRPITPITQLDDIIIANGEPGPLWQEVSQAFNKQWREQ